MTGRMKSFLPAQADVLEPMIRRQALLNHPCEFFKGFFGGRVPTLAEKILWVEKSMQVARPVQRWENDVYMVSVFHESPFVRLSICRKDEQPCHNWRDFQQIKNELVGPNYEAVELYPSERRLVDTSNQYHLWVHVDPNYAFPFGFENRWVLRDPIRIETDSAGRVQTTVTSTVPMDSVRTAAREQSVATVEAREN